MATSRHFISIAPRSINQQEIEIVERKGIGHPDTLADGLAETLSNEYSKYCLEKFGVILHHNLDKVAVVGGLVDIDFGRGKVLEPAKVVINGRMSDSFGSEKIDIPELQKKVTKGFLKKVLPNIDVDSYFNIVNFTNTFSHNPHWYHPRDLEDLPDYKNPYANDTSTCVGYWPLSIVEKLVLSFEGYFYKSGDPKFPFIGQDIKIMAARYGKEISVTMCVPFISTLTPDPDFYNQNLIRYKSGMLNLAKDVLPPDYSIAIDINTADKPNKSDYYLLLTGSCIEAGEEGVVGRGNKSRGVISSVRPYSMEAANGKNPVYHVGKVYTIICDSLARSISEKCECECNVFVTTNNTGPLFDPSNLAVELSKQVDKAQIEKIIEDHLSCRDWTDKIINNGLLVPKPGQGNVYRI